ncbi:MAG: MFS transporter [Elusimicrobia bacterium]|nr:MFS transporter [Elusimicrobiota bacterium]
MAEQTDKKEEKLPFWQSLKILLKASRGFWLINLSNFGDGIAYFGILTLLTRFLGTRVGMSDQMTGVSVSIFTGLVTLFMFGGGFVSDRLGVRKALTLAIGLILAGRAIMTGAPLFSGASLALFMVWAGLFVTAFGEGVIQPAQYAGIKEYTDARTATVGYGILYSIMNLGILVVGFLSPYVRTDGVFMDFGFVKLNGLGLGIDGVFWMCVIITAMMFLAQSLFFTKKIEDTQRLIQTAGASSPSSVPEALRSGNEPKQDKSHLTWKQKLMEFPLMDPKFMFFIFILLPVRTMFAHLFLTFPDYVFRAYPAAVSAKFEWINGINPFIVMFLVPVIAAMTRNVNIVKVMIAGTLVSAATTFILVPGPTLTALLLYIVLFSVGEGIWGSRFLEYISDISPAGKVGAYMGLAGIPWFFAKFTTGLYSGYMLNRFIPASGQIDSSTLWLIYGCFALISPIGLLLARKWLTVIPSGR